MAELITLCSPAAHGAKQVLLAHTQPALPCYFRPRPSAGAAWGSSTVVPPPAPPPPRSAHGARAPKGEHPEVLLAESSWPRQGSPTTLTTRGTRMAA